VAAQRGRAVTEIGAKGKGAADEIRALWAFLDGHVKRSPAAGKAKRKTREAK
jgi:hypothetical protein